MTQLANTTQDLHEALRHNVVQVQFHKVDGSLRIMTATLREQDLPVRVDDVTPAPSNPNLFKVWDLDKQAWRSFKTESLQSWHIVS